MRVKSIVLDGFKSYAHRKELADLSPHFNAITGLNGSGKSNIFDAICFVMGITNLKRVRAEDPRELIFRAGTTGVHAARVTIEFLNDDPATAPPGYSCEDYPVITVGRQIKLGGKQQFFFNNTVSMQGKVKRFFESISLNVDNPHFMVLQGTVHKLIGMRPQDILALVEEAVGTKAFDHRRRTAEALIRGKERKMKEIDDNIETQIGPMLEAMRSDQAEYQRFLQLSEGLDEKRNFRIAYDHHGRLRTISEKTAAIEQLQQQTSEAKDKLQDLPAQEDGCTKRLMALQEKLNQPAEAAIALHGEEVELRKQESRLQVQLEAGQKALRQLEQQRKALHKEQERQRETQRVFEAQRAQHDKLLQDIRDGKERVAKLKQAMQLLQSGVQAGASGLSLAEEKRELELRCIQHGASLSRAKERVDELVAQLARRQQARVQQAGQLKKLEAELQVATRAFAVEQRRFAQVAPLEQRARELDALLLSTKTAYQQAYDTLQRESGSRGFDLDFDRTRPSVTSAARVKTEAGRPSTHASADGEDAEDDLERRVLGRVGELLCPTEPKYALALQVGAQSMLLRVVVESDEVAEKIIRRGLRQRTAFLALNRLHTTRKVDPAQLAAARQLLQSRNVPTDFVCVAKDLVGCRDAAHAAPLRALIEHVFGGFVICPDLALAQEIAYNPAIRLKAVTLDGEVAEPTGYMTGGSTSQLRDLFAELGAYRARKAPLLALRAQLAAAARERAEVHSKLGAQAGVVRAYKAAEEAMEVARQRVALLQGNEVATTPNSSSNGNNTSGGGSGSDGARGGNVVADVEAELREARATVEQTEATLHQCRARLREIDAEANVAPDKAKHELRAKLRTAEQELAQWTSEEATTAAAYARAEADAEQRGVELAQKLRDVEADAAQQRGELDTLTEQLAQATTQLAAVRQRLRETEEQRQGLERSIDEAQAERGQLTQLKAALDNIVKNAEVDLRELHKVLEEARRQVTEDERRYAWLVEARAHFGGADGPYYFDDAARTSATLQALREAEAQAAVLSRRMNRRVTVLYEDRKREYDELVQQRAALSEDKAAIQACILGIEQRKWQTLDRMVRVVSSIFGKLFAACLPGANAELVEERDAEGHLAGLGVRVLFNNKSKESLSELSGGQRSLLALCLILSLLRVRPAPIYILDEVDAALDPSHTQNIGRMLQLYFPHSQFLLVSLKDGMFNNANVIYHVRNTQGYSEVSRVERGQAGASADAMLTEQSPIASQATAVTA